ncbi:MAG TPA: response regulator transcription factor [Candidatus Blautia gallistercoris]|uniref:Stage 0 sporulation protein A homolog n=1 Tax=Candidatus Blautia gallistercoris TaxID=2838490 RepID=A0A9D1WJV5_9FIRM|nr:response regulator transcription factor [Candidatus Blautia gallistercoris]
MRILVVEDEQDLRDLLQKRLSKDYSVDSCSNGLDALEYIDTFSYDVILLDLMLPGLDGLTVLKRIRSRGLTVPVIILTAKGDISDRVTGLDAGADDYLIKPFAYEELTARLRVIFRRNSTTLSNILTVGDLVMDTASKTVKRSGKTIVLTNKEYMLLEYMMRNPEHTLTRTQLEQRAWNESFEGGSNIIDVYIRYLRKKIDDGFPFKMIQTVRGVGYRLLEKE